MQRTYKFMTFPEIVQYFKGEAKALIAIQGAPSMIFGEEPNEIVVWQVVVKVE